jgi:hypothetical protein
MGVIATTALIHVLGYLPFRMERKELEQLMNSITRADVDYPTEIPEELKIQRLWSVLQDQGKGSLSLTKAVTQTEN